MRKRISVRRILFGILLCMMGVVALSGCRHGDARFSSELQSSDAITVTDLAGVTHSFSQPLQKVAVQWSCAGGPFMTMSALLGEDVADYLACIDDSPEKYRADVWEQCQKDIPALADIPVIGSVNEELDLEGLLCSGAEAFLCPLELKTLVDASLADRLKAVDIPVVYVDFHQETMENHVKSTLLLGKLFGREERAQEIVDFYTEHRNAISSRIEEILRGQKRPTLYIEVAMLGPTDFGNSFNNTYSWGGIAWQSGGNSIGEGVVPNYGPLDTEYVLSNDPDKIVFAGTWGTAVPDAVRMGYGTEVSETRRQMEAYASRPGWSDLQAFQNHEVYAINHGLSREMYDCACFEFFAKICFPEQFADISPEETLREYYERFMPYTLDGVWFVL